MNRELSNKNKKPKNKKPKNKPKELPMWMEQRLHKQLNGIRSIFVKEVIDVKNELMDSFHIYKLKELKKSLTKERVVYQKVGDGLLLGAVKIYKRSLSSKFLGDFEKEANILLKDIRNKVYMILEKDSDKNSILYDYFDFEYFAGATPLFWWPFNNEFLKDIYFRNLLIINIYNPLFLIRKLKENGYTVKIKDNEYIVQKELGKDIITMHKLSYFIYAISHHLFKEKKVIDTYEKIVEEVNSKNIDYNSKMNMNINFNMFDIREC